MSKDFTEGMPLVNIVLAEVVTEEEVPETFRFDTAFPKGKKKY